MFYLILAVIIVLIIFGPRLWVNYAIRKHNKPIEEMPGTGAELAEHLIERFKLEGVTVKKTAKDEDYYSPTEKIVGLSPEVYDGKSISAIAIAAHEVGHAIQYIKQEPVSRLRDKYTGRAVAAQNFGIIILSLSPLLGGMARTPVVIGILALAGILAMLSSVVLHALILPEEYDASFGKALPILNEGYLPPEHMPAARQVLKACALTYVAGALADILSVWRWLAILR
ncbi:zinc metallopeptidase [Maricurvus nonylphenolicus]|uniref:zinc metallopeptidase n=1 Tax=Maricurvus nonylphenolicus TaxID=1008307 RepID=UPI0036F443F7